ncbi:MAG: sigma 54-interacting transcriptional regulator [Myxococcales bacterium]|nr:sigma 54-interacting transcriptional regulator [Myxococcales bacterium]
MSDRTQGGPESRTLEMEGVPRRSGANPSRSVLTVVLECARPLAGGARWDVTDFDEIMIGRGSARALEPGNDPRSRALRLPDRRVSTRHARIFRAEDGRRFLEDLGSTNGSRLDGRLVEGPVPLPDRAEIEVGGSFLVFDAQAAPAKERVLGLDAERAPRVPFGMATLVPRLEALFSDVTQIAITNAPILVLGETGTGKELLARAIHELSGRSGPFVGINCGALAGTVLESQLFGHVRGAFSGAERDEPGLIRASDRGTLFLDEIGELPKTAQATLLRVLQEREVLPVGGTRPIKVDFRLVAATLRPIDQLGDGFRSDLYARVAGFTVRLPPLRERREDVGLVLASALRGLPAERAQTLRITPELARALLAYAFPYNARELHQALSVAVTLTKADELGLDALPPAFRRAEERPAAPVEPSELDEDTSRLRAELVERLAATGGNVSEVARAMGRTRMQIHRWMKRFGVDPETFRR